MAGLREDYILNPSDILRLIRSEAWSIITKRRGLPPVLPPSEDLAEQPLGKLELGGPDLNRALTSFLGLDCGRPPDSGETAGSYARNLMDQWRAGSRRIVFHTSGSTGEPKPSPHSESLLRQESAETVQFFKNVGRVVVTVPLLHSYGFIFGVMLPKALGASAVDVPPWSTILAEALRPGDLVVGFPLLFSRMSGFAPADVQFLSATAPCPDQLINTLLNNGVSKFTEIYGASETGAVGIRFSPGPFKLLSYWSKTNEGDLARRLPDGTGLKYPWPDHLIWRDQRRFIPAGRLDQAVQVAGVNVYPGYVASIIKEHPLVKECVVRLMNPAEGFRLKAFVVPRPESPEVSLRQDLNRYIKARLTPPERPGHLTFGCQLPSSLSGKAADWPI